MLFFSCNEFLGLFIQKFCCAQCGLISSKCAQNGNCAEPSQAILRKARPCCHFPSNEKTIGLIPQLSLDLLQTESLTMVPLVRLAVPDKQAHKVSVHFSRYWSLITVYVHPAKYFSFILITCLAPTRKVGVQGPFHTGLFNLPFPGCCFVVSACFQTVPTTSCLSC